MSLLRVIAEITIDRLARAAIKSSHRNAIKEVKESGYQVFKIVSVLPHRRFRTIIAGTCRFLYLLLFIFILIPFPFFILSNLPLLFENPINLFGHYVAAFEFIYVMILIFTILIFLMLFFSNPHTKRSGLGIASDSLMLHEMEHILITEPLKVTGVTTFQWKSVDDLILNSSTEVLVLYSQPKQWWKKLITYPGLRLRFSSSEDADLFLKTGNDFILNLKKNTADAKRSRDLKVIERERINKIMYGRFE